MNNQSGAWFIASKVSLQVLECLQRGKKKIKALPKKLPQVIP